MFWLEAVRPTEEFVALLDTDMLLRAPLDARALGARRGVVVSAEYSYLVGTTTALAERFLDAAQRPLAAQCGGFHIFHRDDMAVIAPLWIEYTRRARAFAHADQEQYLRESFRDWAAASATLDAGERAVRRKQAMWQAEMYGYAFGAAVAGVSHVVRRDTMLYPGYVPHAGILPEILHYGSDFAVEPGPAGGGERLYFNKMTLVDLDLYACADGARGGGRDGDTRAAASGSSSGRRRRATPPARRARRATCCASGRSRRSTPPSAASTARTAAPPPPRSSARRRTPSSARCSTAAPTRAPSAPSLRGRASASPTRRGCSASARARATRAARARPPPRRRGPRPRHAYGPLARLPDPRAADGWHAHHGRRATAKRRLRELAAEHGCAQRCSFFGVRLRCGAALPQLSDAGECADAAAAAAPAAALPHRLSGVVGLAEFGARSAASASLGAAPPRRPRLRRARRHAAARRDRARRARRLLVRAEGAARAGGGRAGGARVRRRRGRPAGRHHDERLRRRRRRRRHDPRAQPAARVGRAARPRALREANVEATAAAAEAAPPARRAASAARAATSSSRSRPRGGDGGRRRRRRRRRDAATVQLVERCAVGVPPRGVSALPDGDAYPHAGALPMRPCARFDRVFLRAVGARRRRLGRARMLRATSGTLTLFRT